MTTVDIDFENYILEVDEDRGVLYIHSKVTGQTVIRLSGLEKQVKVHTNKFDHLIDSMDISLISDIRSSKEKILVSTSTFPDIE